MVADQSDNSPKEEFLSVRRNSMHKLVVIEEEDAETQKKNCCSTSSSSLPASSKCTALLVEKSQMLHQSKTSTIRQNQPKCPASATPLPSCLAESAVVKEKPSLRTRVIVCVLCAAIIVFCWIKLFIWK
uniref:Uncharacterized protein n=1 Tax=Globodera pallida TaxID=36090 RepID=A0A183C9K8_GLOPA